MRICFFCRLSQPELLEIVEFYKQDIKILHSLDPNMVIATKYKEIDWSCDVLFIWWWSYALFPILYGRLVHSMKVIVTGTFNYKTPNFNRDYFCRPWWQKLLLKLSFRYADKNMLVSRYEFEEISKEWKSSNIVYSPHCIDSCIYQYEEKRDTSFIFTIMAFSENNVRRKCLYEILDAIKILKDENHPCCLKIAGINGNSFFDIKEYISKYNLYDRIEFLGEIDMKKKIELLKSCRFYLQPTYFEGFGVAIAEAMSCGAFVISSNKGEVPYVLSDTGFLLEENTASSIANAIKYFWNKDVRIQTKLARKRIEENFSVNRRMSEIIDAICS